MRDRLPESRVVRCDETRVQVMKEPDRELISHILNVGTNWRTAESANDPFLLLDQPSAIGAVAPVRRLSRLSDDRRLRRL